MVAAPKTSRRGTDGSRTWLRVIGVSLDSSLLADGGAPARVDEISIAESESRSRLQPHERSAASSHLAGPPAKGQAQDDKQTCKPNRAILFLVTYGSQVKINHRFADASFSVLFSSYEISRRS